MDQAANYTCKEFVRLLLMELDYKTYMLDQISRKSQELLLAYVLINILSMRIQRKLTNVKNLRVLELVLKMVFTITYQLHMKIRLVVALLELEHLEDQLVVTQLYLKIVILQLLTKKLVKLNVLKPGIIVIGTPLILLILLLNVFYTQEYALLELLELQPLQLIHTRRNKCAIGPIHY
jgi:hypothetical protein